MAMHSDKSGVKFACVEGCSDCCIYRQYYPTKDFGKIGVLLMPEERQKIESLAEQKGISVKIIPRLAIGRDAPEKIIAYQMMGQNDGDYCPFIDREKKSPHSGYSCSIYDKRPLACVAYPVVDFDQVAKLDTHCQFCKKYSMTASLDGIQDELESLSKIREKVHAGNGRVWRYATATGSEAVLPEGWVLET